MELYKVSLQLASPLVTPLKGDTIWGHVVWGIANHEGEDAVTDFINSCKGTEPAFVISSAFPQGTICRPIPVVQKRQKSMTPEKYAEIKKSKKRVYASAADYFGDNAGSDNELGNPFETVTVTHNSINRFSNTVADGSLYAIAETWSKCLNFDVYIATTYDTKRIKQLCEWAFENGFGADASTGKGVVSVIGEPQPVRPKCESNTYLALAPFVIPESFEVSDLRADTFVRNGKIGGAFASSMIPWKKTVVLFNEGAVFTSKNSIKVIGTLLTDVHSDSRICQSGFAPVIPIPEE